MNKPTLQIDLKPIDPENRSSYFIKLCFDGATFTGICSAETAHDMQRYGLVEQCTGQREENGKLIDFEYPDKVDGAGVQFTSKVFIEK